MKRIALLAIILLGCMQSVVAQQDPMFTKYMFNPLNYNPAYAGSVEALDVVLLHRQQWIGIEGAPMTQNLGIHSPIQGNTVGLGLNLAHDQIGANRQTNLFGSFSYRLRFSERQSLYLGVQGGVSNWQADWSDLTIMDPNDPAFQNLNPNLWLPNFGAGLYYTGAGRGTCPKTHWYVGLSAPMLLTNKLRPITDNGATADFPVAQQYRHYYLSAGMAYRLTPTITLRPSFLLKNVGLFIERNAANSVAAPNEIDLDLAVLFNNVFWVGAAFRTALEGESSYDSVDFWLSLRLNNGLRIGVAYDYALTELQGPGQGSYELLLGYDLFRGGCGAGDNGRIEHVRYF